MQFYSYLWLREDGSPYYVGKGQGNRAFLRHRHPAPPADRARIVVVPAANEAEAFASEIVMIDLFGRKDQGTGCLRNSTDGGDGASGRPCTDEAKRKISVANSGKPGRNKGQLSWNKGISRSEETKQKISDAKKGQPKSEGHKQKLSAALKGRIGRKHTEETKQKLRLVAARQAGKKRGPYRKRENL